MIVQSIAAIIMNFSYIFLKVRASDEFLPVLSSEDEKLHFGRFKSGDLKSRDILIERNLRLVAHIVKKCYIAYKDQEDLLSVGTIGLIKAIDTYALDNGAKFATYACTCVKNEILMYFRASKKQQQETSIYEPIEMDKDGKELTYIDTISVEDTIADDLDRKIKSEKARKIIEEKLGERERQIIKLRYGLSDFRDVTVEPMTQKQVAEVMNISRSYVSRLEKNALALLSSELVN
ncbi:RNA polymerase sigma factor [Clostridia bacterium]|nr:RNA polymerase sigma factor [Clostridia bacterium]